MDDSLIGLPVPVHITKYDGSYHRRWPCRYVARKGDGGPGRRLHMLTFARGDYICCTPDPADDPAPTPIRFAGDLWVWEDRWFNVSRMKRDGRTWYYVNIATPAEFDGAQFHTIDMDLDVDWYPGEDPQVLDEDEFLDHAAAMRYPADVIERARAAVDEVLGMIGERAFPFDRA
jgi:protein associated with RNAse G/E